MLPVTFLEKRKGVLAVAKLGIKSRQVTGRNIMGPRPISKAVQFPLHQSSLSAALEGTLNGGGGILLARGLEHLLVGFDGFVIHALVVISDEHQI